jgi:hypothetical protein
MDRDLPLRVTLVGPPRGVRFAVQRGKSEYLDPVSATEEEITFELSVRVRNDRPDGSPNILGPFAQGPLTSRFLYVNSGAMAAQPASIWTRRAKLPFATITWALLEEALASGALLEARITATARDGGPACATVPLLGGGWKPAPR